MPKTTREHLAGKYLRACCALAIVVVVALAMPRGARAQGGTGQPARAFCLAAEGRYDELVSSVEQAGGQVLHAFPPAAAIVAADQGLLQRLVELGVTTYATTGPLPADTLATLSGTQLLAASAWQALAEPPLSAFTLQELAPPPNDALVAPATDGVSALALDPSLYQQSEYMTGKVVVNLVLVESDGTHDANLEDWSAEEQATVFQEIVAAMDWWQAMEPRAHLQFIYDDHFSSPIPIQYEPISRPHSDERLWVGQAMQRLGFSASSYITAVRQHNRDSRQRYGADWAFTVFVVDSSNDADNHFADGYFAYAYIYGPFMVLTYGNNGYGPHNMDAVAAHEMGHIFGALDEYASANVPPSALGGYLGVPNGNSEVGGYIDEDCIMRGGVAPFALRRLCHYSAGQVGWWDSDSDGILDPLDTLLALSAAVESDLGLTLGASVSDEPYPSTERTPITTNVIASAEYRVNDGVWRPMLAGDGAFDSASEEAEATLPAAPAGEWQLEVRVTDSAGNAASQLLPLSVAEGTAAPLTLAEATLTTPEAGRLECLGTATVPADAGAVQVVEYSLDAGAWQAATSADGEWDSTSEGVTLSLTGLGGGLHSLRLRTVATLPWAVPQVWEQSVEVAEPASGPPPTLALYIPFVSIAVGAY